MKESIILILVSGLLFLVAISVLIWGILKKKRSLIIISVIAFIAFLGSGVYTGYNIAAKSYNKIADVLGPRSGDEIYDALFDKRQTNCVRVLNYQDQVVPKIDYAIWLHFETCPAEVRRILSRFEFSEQRIAIMSTDAEIPQGQVHPWFSPKTLGDTAMLYEYTSSDHRNIQTIWVNLDSTRAFCRDIYD